MKYIFRILLFLVLLSGYVLVGDLQADSNKKKILLGILMLTLMFSLSYILGQTIKSGAVYLLQRKKSEIKGMLEYREDYRQEILEDSTIKDIPASGNNVQQNSLSGKGQN